MPITFVVFYLPTHLLVQIPKVTLYSVSRHVFKMGAGNSVLGALRLLGASIKWFREPCFIIIQLCNFFNCMAIARCYSFLRVGRPEKCKGGAMATSMVSVISIRKTIYVSQAST